MGGGPENGAESGMFVTPNIHGRPHSSFLKNRRGKSSDTGFEIIRPRRSQPRVAMVCPTDISEINFTSSTNSDATLVQLVESGVTDISVSLVQTRLLVCF